MGGSFFKAQNLTKRFGGLTAVNSVSFELRREQIVGLIGPNGAGKTTLLRLITKILRPDAGRIFLHGEDLTGLRPWEVVERGIAGTFQNTRPFRHLPIVANVMVPLIGPRNRRSGEWVKRIEAKAMDALEFVGISDMALEPASALSQGDLKRLEVARAIATEPELLLLDEPLAALDYVTQSRIIDDLRTWNRARNLPILYVTHSHREVYALAERVIVLEQGRLVADGTPHDVLQSPTEESVAQLAGFENFFDATVVTVRPDAGTMQCHLDGSGADLEVPLSAAPVGSKVRVAIRAGDILLANREPAGLSARNVLAGTIAALKREGARIVAEVDAGNRFVVHLTPGAVESLELAVGRGVWLVVKTHSCRLLRDKWTRL